MIPEAGGGGGSGVFNDWCISCVNYCTVIMVIILLEARRFGCKMTVNISFFIDIFFFHVHLTVSFFSKLVIPVHVSMEEPVFKTKVERNTTVNVLVDGKGTIANKSLQVPTNIKKRSCLYICGL